MKAAQQIDRNLKADIAYFQAPSDCFEYNKYNKETFGGMEAWNGGGQRGSWSSGKWGVESGECAWLGIWSTRAFVSLQVQLNICQSIFGIYDGISWGMWPLGHKGFAFGSKVELNSFPFSLVPSWLASADRAASKTRGRRRKPATNTRTLSSGTSIFILINYKIANAASCSLMDCLVLSNLTQRWH